MLRLNNERANEFFSPGRGKREKRKKKEDSIARLLREKREGEKEKGKKGKKDEGGHLTLNGRGEEGGVGMLLLKSNAKTQFERNERKRRGRKKTKKKKGGGGQKMFKRIAVQMNGTERMSRRRRRC